MCRQDVSCLLPLYNQNEEQLRSNEFNETFNQINIYNRKFSGGSRNVLKTFFWLLDSIFKN